MPFGHTGANKAYVAEWVNRVIFRRPTTSALETDTVRVEGRRHSYGMERFLRRNVSFHRKNPEDGFMNGIIYLVGLIVVIGVILSFFGLR